MTDKTPENRIDALEKKLEESHWAIANVQSKGLNDLYTKMAVHTEILNRIEKAITDTNVRIDGVNVREDVRNGRLGKVENKISQANGWIKGVGIATGIIIMLVSALFESRLGIIKSLAEGTKEMLITHLKTVNGQQ